YGHGVGVGRVERVIPGAGRELDHAPSHAVGHHSPGQTTAAVVEHAYHVAVADVPGFGVGGVKSDRLAPAHLGRLAEGADVELAGQAGRRVVRGPMGRVAGPPPGGAPPRWGPPG